MERLIWGLAPIGSQTENEMKKSALLEGKCRMCWKFDWKSGECGSKVSCYYSEKFEAFEAERETMEDCLARGNWVVADER